MPEVRPQSASGVSAGPLAKDAGTGRISAARRREILSVALVLLAATVLRAIYLWQYREHIPYYSHLVLDSAYYDAWAQRVAHGVGYGPMPFYMAPLYPYVLAAIYAISGHNLPLVYVLQAALGVCNLFLVYLLGRRLFGHWSGLAAMVFVLLYAPLMYLESKILTETLAVALNLGSILLLMRALDRPTLFRYLSAGIALGLSAVCRPTALLTVALILVWFLFGARSPRRSGAGFRHLGMLILGIMLAILPVTARNYLVGRDFALITTNFGIVFAQGSYPSSDGTSTALPDFSGLLASQQEEEMSIAQKALGHPVKPSESSAYWLKRGFGFIREHPGRYTQLLGRKLIWTLHNREAPCNYNVYLERRLVPVLRYLPLPYALLAGLALFGFVCGRRAARESDVLALYILSILLGLLIFSVTSRYRVSAVPALAVFAGFGLVQAVDSVRRRNLRAVGAVAACIALVSLFSLVPYPIPPVTAEGPANLGTSYLAAGRTVEAMAALEESLAIDPNFAYAHLVIGDILVHQGKIDEAIERYSQALRADPDCAPAHNNLGAMLLRNGRLQEAVSEFRKALRLNPDVAEAHVGLAAALEKMGRAAEAKREREAAARCTPNLAEMHYNRGVVLEGEGKLDAAVREYREAVRINRDFVEAHVNLGLALKNQGRIDEAIREYREAIRIKPDLASAHNNLAVSLYLKGDYAEAWKEVRLCRKYGGNPHPGFLKALSEKMPGPAD